VKGERMFIAWDYKCVDLKYLSCVLEGIYALDVVNMPKYFLYENIPKKFHFITHDYFNRIQQ
jgi:hypothetical protein